MKKIIISTFILAALGLGFSGCLKDKGFDNNQYGIKDPQSSADGVGFPWAYSADVNISSINPSTSAQTVLAPTVIFAADQAAPVDIHVNLVANQALVATWNSNPDHIQLTTFPSGGYTIPSLKVTIPKGSRYGSLSITIPTTTGLSFSNIYGLGFSIASIDESGYQIASNIKNVVIGINVSNKFAGDYTTTGYLFHPSSPRALSDDKPLATVSDITSRAGLGDLYTSNYYFDFDVTGTNTLTNWVARGACPAAPASGFFTADVPNPGGTVFPVATPPGSAPYLHTTYNNTYVPASKTFYMHYGYGVGSSGQSGWTRQVYEKWVKD